MSDDTAAVRNPRRLVVYFFDNDHDPFLAPYLIQNDSGDRPQLIRHRWICRPPAPAPAPAPSRLDRLLFRLRLKPPPSKAPEEENLWDHQAVANARGFLSGNYRSGDQVILVLGQSYSGNHLIKPMEILARHLHDGTRPGEPSQPQPRRGENLRGKRIPIHGMAVFLWRGKMESISLFNDKLKSRFPPGIEHLVCLAPQLSSHIWSCYTVFDSDGAVISREISVFDSNSHRRNHFIHATMGLIYYAPWRVMDWDELAPGWTQVLHSTPSGIPRNFPLSTLPAGTHRHELTRYQGGSGGSDRLVWKSFRQ